MPDKNQTYDAFLNYNSKDKKEVIIIAQLLENEGIKTWFDAWNVLAGDPWQEKLENALDHSKAVIVLIGAEGIGPWQNEEIRTAIDEWVTKRSIRVIPVLLPNAKEVPKFLKNFSWAVFKDNIYEENTLSHIIRSIRGEIETDIPLIIKSPYRGLEVFKEEHQNLFFGREEEVAEIVLHLTQHHFMAVIGVSGSGKSSMVQAGVIPKLRKQDNIKAVLLMKPGEKPVEELATAIFHSLKENEHSNEAAKEDIINLIPLLIENKETLHLKARQFCPKEEDKILLVIDQFEELFLLAEKGKQRDAFIELLMYALAKKKTQIIITMRSDFIGKVGEFPLLNQTVIQNLTQIGTMNEEKLNDIIVKPALIAGIIFEKGLEQRILFEVKNSTGKLPLIEFALDQLFENKNGNWFEHAVYEKIGGVTGALSKHAEAQYDKLDKEEKALLQKMFTYFFIYPGEGFEDTKRRVNKTNLLNIDAKAEKVIQTFLTARLLSITEDKEQGITYVEVAHEALISNWNRIQDWIKDERENNRIYNNLKPDANAYFTTQDNTILYSGLTLTKIEAFYEGNKDIFSEIESLFVEDSIKLRQHNINRRRWLVAGIIVILLIALLVSLYFFKNANEANKETKKQLVNNYFQVALKEEIENFKLHKLAMALQIYSTEDDFSRRLKFYYSVATNPFINILGFEAPVYGAAFNKIEDKILSWSRGGKVKIWEVQTGKIDSIQHDEWVRGAAFNKNEDKVLSWSDGGSVKLWDVQTGKVDSLQYHKKVSGAAFNKNEDKILSWSEDGSVRLWEVQTGKVDSFQHNKSVYGAAFNKNEDRILSWGDINVKLWKVQTGKVDSLQHDKTVNGAAFTKNEDKILSWSEDGSIKLWEVKTGKVESLQHDNPVQGAVLNKNENRILSWDGNVSLSGYGSVSLWEIQTGKVESLQHDKSVMGATFNENEDKILSWSGDIFGGSDGSVKLWDLQTGKVDSLQHDDWVRGATFNKDEDKILSWSNDVNIKLWNLQTGKVDLLQHDKWVYGAAFNKNEDKILSWSGDGSVKIWDMQIGKVDSVQNGKSVYGVTFFKNDKLLIWCVDDSIKLWNMQTGKVDLIQYYKRGNGAAFNKKENKILSWNNNGNVNLLDIQTGKIDSLQHNKSVKGATFNKNVDKILSWSEDIYKSSYGSVKLWNLQTGKLDSLQHDASVNGATFNKNEDKILSWNNSGGVKLWNLQTGKIDLLLHDDWVQGAAFNKNEDKILSWSDDGYVKLWDIQSDNVDSLKHDNSVRVAIFNKNEDKILSWSGEFLNGCVILWDVLTGKVDLLKHNRSVQRATFNKNEDKILSWDDSSVKLWDVQTGKVDSLQNNGLVLGATFNKSEDKILSWSGDVLQSRIGVFKLWHAQTGQPIIEPIVHSYIKGAFFNKDGSLILSWSKDDVKLWDAHNGVQIGQTMRHTNAHNGLNLFGHTLQYRDLANVTFDQAQKRILSWSYDGSIKLWDVPGDLDLPKNEFLLQTQVTTGTIYNENTDALEFIPPNAWQEKKKAWLIKAKAHAKECQYPRQNVFINYYATHQDSSDLKLLP